MRWMVHSFRVQLLGINDYYDDYSDSCLRKIALAKVFFKSLRIIHVHLNWYN